MTSPSAMQQVTALLEKFDPDQVREILGAFGAMHGLPAGGFSKFATTTAGNTRITKPKPARHKKKTLSDHAPPIRPLNSWMAFRSYYSPIFKSVQQKNISGHLKQLWAADEFHTKWAIVAKAYALLRAELTKEEAPLDSFLDLVAPYCGALSREQYFPTMGWTLEEENGDGVLKRTFIPTSNMIPDSYRFTMVSSEELVDYCIANNFISRQSIAKLKRTTGGAVNLTMAVPPPSPTHAPPKPSQRSNTITVDCESAIDRILREALDPKSNQHQGHTSLVDSRATAECRGIAHAGLAKMDGLPLGQLFDPFDDLQYPAFDPCAGPRDAVFNIGDPSLYSSLDACDMNNPDDVQIQLAMQSFLGL